MKHTAECQAKGQWHTRMLASAGLAGWFAAGWFAAAVGSGGGGGMGGRGGRGGGRLGRVVCG